MALAKNGAVPSIIFVCHGNICRSPMAEIVARSWAEQRGIMADFSSAGISSEEVGNPIDYRAAKTLTSHGYLVGTHRPHKITAAEIRSADLVIAAEPTHVAAMRRLVKDAVNLSVITDYIPNYSGRSGLPDPWYGGMEGFEYTLEVIEAAMPGVMDKIESLSS